MPEDEQRNYLIRRHLWDDRIKFNNFMPEGISVPWISWSETHLIYRLSDVLSMWEADSRPTRD